MVRKGIQLDLGALAHPHVLQFGFLEIGFDIGAVGHHHAEGGDALHHHLARQHPAGLGGDAVGG